MVGDIDVVFWVMVGLLWLMGYACLRVAFNPEHDDEWRMDCGLGGGVILLWTIAWFIGALGRFIGSL